MIDLQPDLELTHPEAEAVLAAWLGRRVSCSRVLKLEGGLVNTTFSLEFDRPPRRAVIKVHSSAGGRLATEAQSLDYLRTRTSCPVPRPYLHDSSARLLPYAFLLMEQVPGVCLKGLDLDPAERTDIDTQLARVLTALHDHTGSRWGGIDTDDEPVAWADLFVGRLRNARSQPAVEERLTSDVLERVDLAIDVARPALQDPGVPTLVHGDVWDGNLMVQQVQDRWRLTGLLDPDLQFADVEYELAYLEVFDGSHDALFATYLRHRTLRPGYERRRLLYWLHTALVHVALFGDEYFRRYTARITDDIIGSARGDQ